MNQSEIEKSIKSNIPPLPGRSVTSSPLINNRELPKKNEIKQKFPCQYCHKNFTTKSNLLAHQTKTKKCLIIQSQGHGQIGIRGDNMVAPVTANLQSISQPLQSVHIVSSLNQHGNIEELKNRIDQSIIMMTENQKLLMDIISMLISMKTQNDLYTNHAIDSRRSIPDLAAAYVRQQLTHSGNIYSRYPSQANEMIYGSVSNHQPIIHTNSVISDIESPKVLHMLGNESRH